MVTATTATPRTAVNKFGAVSHTVTYATTSLIVVVQSQDSAGNNGELFTLQLSAAGSWKIVFGADGVPIVQFDATKTTQAVGAFLAFSNAAGNAQARANALDAYLQAQGIYPA